MARKMSYTEPGDYFPKEIRKKYKLGEFDDSNKKDKAPAKKTVKKTAKKK